ncbi:MAG: hypothetical protein CMB56_004595 [Methanobacteriota archaeon]|nr:MAG: hypothetical protein CMB56_004595 [Euryarchaeota archaeon]|tara:strand:- start:2786 stop:3217 length:432 start_codon:yes stop_codon:yes gene_type:complete
MRSNNLNHDTFGQMLLAAGLVLLMSLLSMSLYGVKVAGYDLPRTSDVSDVIIVTQEIDYLIEDALENRTSIRMDAGMELDDAVLDSLNSIESDLENHGILRGIQISFSETEIIIEENQITVNLRLNVVSDSTIELPMEINYEI